MERLLFVVTVFSLGISIFLFIFNLFNHGFSEMFSFKHGLGKASLIFFGVYLISFLLFFVVTNFT